MGPLLVLEAGRLTATVAPHLGGSLVAFCEQTPSGPIDWLRRAPPDCTNVLQSACYVLAPFSNRIENGRFCWRGRKVCLPANFPPEAHALHGFAWQRPWDVVESAAGRVVLTMAYDEGPWPWPFEVCQTLTLGAQSLSIALVLKNRSSDPMPGGLGLHPFFPRSEGTAVRAAVHAIQIAGADRMPTHLDLDHPAIAALGAGEAVPLGLDNAFEHWSGQLSVHQGDIGRTLKLSASPVLRHLVLYTPEGAPFFCAEPVSHLNGAFNADTEDDAIVAGLCEIPPGGTLEGAITLTPASMPRS